MNCSKVEEKLGDFVAGHLALDERAALKLHLESCPVCTRFHDNIREIYQMSELAPTTPDLDIKFQTLGKGLAGEVKASLNNQRRWSRISVRTAAAALLLLCLVVTYWLSPIDFHRIDSKLPDTASNVDNEPLFSMPLMNIEVSFPSFPTTYAAGVWHNSLEDAQEQAKFTGLPILEEYIYPSCPLCINMEQEMLKPESQEMLLEFICYRGNVELDVPEWVSNPTRRAGNEFIFPAMRVRDDELESEPYYGITELEKLNEIISCWDQLQKLRSLPQKEPLRGEIFTSTQEKFQQVEKNIGERNFSAAVQQLLEISALGAHHRTAFVPAAESLLDELESAFQSQLCVIEKLYQGDSIERRQAIDLAKRFHKEIDGLPISDRLLAYTR